MNYPFPSVNTSARKPRVFHSRGRHYPVPLYTRLRNTARILQKNIEEKFSGGVYDELDKILNPTLADKVVENLKTQLCNKLIQSNLLKDGYVINHSYTNGLNGKNPNSRQKLEDYIETIF